MQTRDQIVRILRREALTINELADRLGMTRNAIVLPIQQMEAENVITAQERRSDKAGKPPKEYRVLPGDEDSKSAAYKPFLEIMMSLLPDYLGPEKLDELLHKVGLAFAGQLDISADDSFADKVTAAAGLMDGVGAEADLDQSDGEAMIVSYTCPMGGLVRDHPCICGVVKTFLATATGGAVEELCEREERLVCRFRIQETH